jgi:hypothetical protein
LLVQTTKQESAKIEKAKEQKKKEQHPTWADPELEPAHQPNQPENPLTLSPLSLAPGTRLSGFFNL